MKPSIKLITALFFLVSLAACQEYTPKPHGYPKIDFPVKNYTLFKNDCPFTFEIPVYSQMIADTNDLSEPCWYNLYFHDFDAILHMSYKHFKEKDQLDSMTEDAYKLVYKHTIKAEDIEEMEVSNSFGNSGIFYDLSGNTATAFNFYMSDDKNHFVRGAFYFNNHTERDSVMPVVEFVKKDIFRLMNTLKFDNQ